MMGSPFYYDVLSDDGPGDVVFHDCMWSGICTCCIQLLHQDSFYYTNESPDLKVDLSYQQQQLASGTNNQNGSSCLTKESHHLNHHHTTNANFSLQQHQDLKVAGHLMNHNHHHHTNSSSGNHHLDSALSLSSNCNSPVIASAAAASHCAATAAATTSTINNKYNHHHHRHSNHLDTSNHKTSSSTSFSPDHTNSSSNSASPDTASSSLSNSTSPKPVRRREHNDSERKRRDHLRNAFNFLRDQVPRFKAISKKPPRIQILHEATMYVKNIIKESQELERRLADERAKHERLQNH